MKKYNVVIHSLLVDDSDVEREVLEPCGAKINLISNENVEEFYKAAEKADALIIADRKIDVNLINSMENCKIIARQGVGFETIDLDISKEKGIAVTNVPDYCVDEVSDFAMSLILSSLRYIPQYDRHVKSGTWDIESIMTINRAPEMRRLSTRVLGVVGLGKIARQVVKKAKAFGIKIISYDPFIDKDVVKELGVELVELDYLIKNSDIITLHSPLTEENKYMFNLETFKSMKDTAFIINTSRGPLIKEEDLYIALKNRYIAGAAIDVMEIEPPAKDNPLLTLDNIIITPHAAFFTKDSYEELRRKAAEEVKRVLEGKEPKNRVNK